MISAIDKSVATLQAQLALAGWVCKATSTSTDAAQTFTVSRWGQVRTIPGLAELDAFARQVGCTGVEQNGGQP